jgi:hypothetical protein
MSEPSCPSDCCQWGGTTNNEKCVPIPGLGAGYCDKDGLIDAPYEQCDPGNGNNQNLSGQTCESKEHEPGTLSCTQECMFNFDLCGGKCQQDQTTSSWTDTGLSSKDDCSRVFNGVPKECCPNDQTCWNVQDTSTNHNINTCVKSGVVRCGGLNGYENEEDCNNFAPAIAEASIEEIPAAVAAGITCGTTCTGADCIFTRCLCVWNSTYNECQAGAEEIGIVNGVTTTIGQCSYSITEGACNRGTKMITYTAVGSMPGCVKSEAEVSCFAATEIPFFNFWSLMVTITGIIVFYVIRKR